MTARLRLFANLRELAGTAETQVSGSTVGEVLAEAVERFGSDFGRALEPSQVWVDGEQASSETPVPDGSEVAVIPPVSGGSTVVQNPVALEIGLVALFIGLLLAANQISLQWFAVVTVLVGGVWAFDITGAADRRGLPLASTPILLAVFAGSVATYRFGTLGMAGATAGALLVTLVWSVISRFLRSVDSFSAGIVLATATAFGSSSLVLLRVRSEEETLIFLFLLAVAVLVVWLTDHSELPVMDPLVALIVGAVLAGAVGGALWAEDLLNALAASVAAAIALVAGRNLGMLLRAGGFFAQGPFPGSLAYFDGALMAAGAYWTIMTVLT